MRCLCVVFACWVHLGSLPSPVQSAEKASQPCPFHLRAALVSVAQRPPNLAPTTLAETTALPAERQTASLRAAIEDLMRTFPKRYPDGPEFLKRLEQIEKQTTGTTQQFDALRREALIANPLIVDQPILFVVRQQYRSHYHAIDTLFHTDEFNPDRSVMHSTLFGPGGALKTIDFARDGEVKTLLDVPGAVFNAHLIPGTQQIVCILGMHHDRLWGALGIVDRN